MVNFFFVFLFRNHRAIQSILPTTLCPIKLEVPSTRFPPYFFGVAVCLFLSLPHELLLLPFDALGGDSKLGLLHSLPSEKLPSTDPSTLILRMIDLIPCYSSLSITALFLTTDANFLDVPPLFPLNRQPLYSVLVASALLRVHHSSRLFDMICSRIWDIFLIPFFPKIVRDLFS